MVRKEDVLAVMAGRYVDFYADFTPLCQEGGEWRGACPLHGGNGRNFAVNAETGLWKCHSQCQAGGDIFAFVQQKNQKGFVDALREVAEWAGGPTTGKDTKPTPRRPKARALDGLTGRSLDPAVARRAHEALMNDQDFVEWLADHRSLTADTLERFQVGLLEPDPTGARRIAFPVFDLQGNLTNIRRHLFAYKDGLDRTHKTLPWEKGLQADLFPLPVLLERGDVLLVEGEADALLAIQMGFTAVTGTLGSGNWKEHWTEALRGTAVTILYDADKAGQGGTLKAAAHLAAADCAVGLAALPEGRGKDLTEWVVVHGGTADDVRAVIEAALPYIPTKPADAPPNSDSQKFSLSSGDSKETGGAPGAAAGKGTAPGSTASVTLPNDSWPEAACEMFYGLAGDIVRTIEPHTEADPVALLVQFLAAYGSAIGRNAHFAVEADRHYANLFVVLIGVSSKGRKGTSLGHVRRLFTFADPEWEEKCVQSGLSTGEGLIWHVRDPIEKSVMDKETGDVEVVTLDPGIEDKRLLAIESEYAAVLRLASRDGNNLSAVLRDAWDRGQLQTMTKTSPVKATGAHVSLIGHVTADELRRELSSTEAGNGFANRFLWICAKRSKELPEGGNLTDRDLHPLIERLASAIETGRQAGQLARDEAARQVWLAVYHDLSAGAPGLSGAITSRGEAQVMRLALLYALLDRAEAIGRGHLTAALALWEYVEASARYVFGDSMGDPIADDILRALRNAPDGLSRNDIRELFQRHQSSGRIGQALALLLQHSRVRVEQKNTSGRPAEWWHIAKPYASPGAAAQGPG